MREFNLTTHVRMYAIGELAEADRSLYEKAFASAVRAYAPYSHFQVGAAALLDNGEIVCGNNQENAAYPSGLCAERTTLFYAGACYPESSVLTLAIAAVKGRERVAMVTPCGACRQVLLETEQRHGWPLRILLCGREEVYEISCAAALLPLCFGKADAGDV